jgi:serine/threonine-protein kinase
MFSSEPEIRARFLREGYVRQPHPAPRGGEHPRRRRGEDGAAFLVMELLDGVSLFDELRERGRLAPLEALFIADQLLDVLAAAHAPRVIHRDIKPGNVFLLAHGGSRCSTSAWPASSTRSSRIS